jgi:hypothetical protein
LPRSAAGQEDQYIRIYDLIQAGDNFRDTGRAVDASSRYTEAQAALQRFQKSYPDWNSNVVRFRLEYLASELAAISTNARPTSASTGGTNGTSRVASTAANPDERVNALQAEVRQLRIDKAMLEAKLKEAMSAQPAALDPREFAKAQEQIARLQKENELLKVNAEQQQTKTAPTVDSKAYDALKQKLAETERNLTEQTELAKALEKTALQEKLARAPSPSSAPNVAANDQKLAEQTDAISKLNLEKTALQMRVKNLSAEAEKVTALQQENQSLKKQLAELKIIPDTLSADAERKLNSADAKIATLQSERDALLRDKIVLENRIKAMSTSSPPATQP